MNQSIIRRETDRKRPTIVMDEGRNIFTTLVRARKAMRAVGWTTAEIAEATTDMLSGDEDHLADVIYDLCEVNRR